MANESHADVQYERHNLLVRVTHWVVAFAYFGALITGLFITQTYPRFHWNDAGNVAMPALFTVPEVWPENLSYVGNWPGVKAYDLGPYADRFLSLPVWDHAVEYHPIFAWLIVLGGVPYLIGGAFSGRLRKDLLPSRAELTLTRIAGDLRAHVQLRFPKDEEARSYNPLQKCAYCFVIFGAFPLMWLSGLTLSPPMNAALPWLKDMLGGRQTARTVHFATAMTLLVFVVVHLLMVLVSGFQNNLRSMISGRYKLPQD